jgi:hypothetical protein
VERLANYANIKSMIKESIKEVDYVKQHNMYDVAE